MAETTMLVLMCFNWVKRYGLEFYLFFGFDDSISPVGAISYCVIIWLSTCYMYGPFEFYVSCLMPSLFALLNEIV